MLISWRRETRGDSLSFRSIGLLSVDEEGGAAIANLEYDFTQGGLYVAGAGNVRVEEGPTEIRFKFKADTPLTVGIRLVDKTNQTHQYQFAYTDEGQWQEYRVDLAEKAGLIFGGKGDKVLHLDHAGVLHRPEEGRLPVGQGSVSRCGDAIMQR